jgi:hypothetical protein
MLTRSRFLTSLLLSSLFIFVTLFINFFHTETAFSESDNCPACHFQNSSITTGQIHIPFVPQPVFFGIQQTSEFFHYTFLTVIEANSRDPPKI